MAKSQKKTPTEPPEIPAEKPKRKQALKPLTVTVDDLLAAKALTTAAELPPPHQEVIQPDPNTARPRPSPHKNGEERPLSDEPSFAQKIARPTAPRKRVGEPAVSFASKDLRIDLMDRVWQIDARRELTGVEKDRLAESGFRSVDEDEKVWNGHQSELAKRGTDINLVAYELSGKAGRGR